MSPSSLAETSPSYKVDEAWFTRVARIISQMAVLETPLSDADRNDLHAVEWSTPTGRLTVVDPARIARLLLLIARAISCDESQCGIKERHAALSDVAATLRYCSRLTVESRPLFSSGKYRRDDQLESMVQTLAGCYALYDTANEASAIAWRLRNPTDPFAARIGAHSDPLSAFNRASGSAINVCRSIGRPDCAAIAVRLNYSSLLKLADVVNVNASRWKGSTVRFPFDDYLGTPTTWAGWASYRCESAMHHVEEASPLEDSNADEWEEFESQIRAYLADNLTDNLEREIERYRIMVFEGFTREAIDPAVIDPASQRATPNTTTLEAGKPVDAAGPVDTTSSSDAKASPPTTPRKENERADVVGDDRLKSETPRPQDAADTKQVEYLHSADFTSVEWFGEVFQFSAGHQAKAVGILWREWQKGFSVSQATICEEIESNAERYSLSQTFRKHPAYKKMIQQVKGLRGFYTLHPKKPVG
jgi:hypothetical protein